MQRGQPTGGTIDAGWPLEEGQGRAVGERSSSRKECRGSTWGTTALPIGGAQQQRLLDILWRSTNSGVEEAANRYEGGQHMHYRRGDDAKASSTYCGRALHDSDGGVGGHPRTGTHPVCERRFCARTTHAGSGGSHRGRSVPVGVAGWKPTSPPGGTG